MNDDQLRPPSASPKRFFDIVPARKTVPDATSRPIIVSQNSEQPDPMMVEKETAVAQPVAVETPPVPSEPVPPIEIEAPPEPVPASEAEGAPELETSVEPELPELPLDPPETLPEPADDTDSLLAMPTLELPPNAQAGAVVSHHRSANRRTTALIIVIVVLVIIVVDLILDTGLIKSTLPHTRLFGT